MPARCAAGSVLGDCIANDNQFFVPNLTLLFWRSEQSGPCAIRVRHCRIPQGLEWRNVKSLLGRWVLVVVLLHAETGVRIKGGRRPGIRALQILFLYETA